MSGGCRCCTSEDKDLPTPVPTASPTDPSSNPLNLDCTPHTCWLLSVVEAFPAVALSPASLPSPTMESSPALALSPDMALSPELVSWLSPLVVSSLCSSRPASDWRSGVAGGMMLASLQDRVMSPLLLLLAACEGRSRRGRQEQSQ